MYVRALHSFHHYGNVRQGEILEVYPDIAAQLIENRLVVEMQEQPAAPVLPADQMAVPVKEQEAPKSGVGPFEPSPNGGQTGPEKPQSSSRPAPQRKTRPSKSAAAAPASSRSTAHGNSAHGQTSSTPATPGGGSDTKVSRNSEG